MNYYNYLKITILLTCCIPDIAEAQIFNDCIAVKSNTYIEPVNATVNSNDIIKFTIHVFKENEQDNWISEQTILSHVAAMQSLFDLNNTGIQFVLNGINYHVNSSYVNLALGDYRSPDYPGTQTNSMLSQYNVQGVFNFYYIKTINSAQTIATSIKTPSTNLLLSQRTLTDSNAMTHEMGHCLGLQHVWLDPYFRDYYDMQYEPDGEVRPTTIAQHTANVNCTTLADTDDNPKTTTPTPNELRYNIMNYGESVCRTFFAPSQIITMKNTLISQYTSVTLHNKWPGYFDSFGELYFGALSIPSGVPEKISKNLTTTVKEKTLTKSINVNSNVLSASGLKWNKNDFEAQLVGNLFHDNIQVKNNDVPQLTVSREFREIYTLSVKNSLEGTTTNGGSFYFKNPTTTNTLDVTLIPSGGFVKNNAFGDLEENIPGYGLSKYAIKAFSTFTDGNGIVWNWQSGDFNPSAPTDLLLTANTTKTAIYKGQLVSNTSGWVQNSMVNFNSQNAVLYKSMNELWLHLDDIEWPSVEIKVASASELPSAFSVLQHGSEFFVSYVNNLGKIMVKKYSGAGTLVSAVDLQNASLPANTIPQLIAGKAIGVCHNCEDPEANATYYISVWYQDGTSVKHKPLTLNTGIWESWSDVSLSAYLTSSIKVQSATNGQFGYLYWTKNNVLYSSQFKGLWDSPVVVSNNSYQSSKIHSVAGTVNSSGDLVTVYSQQRGSFSSVFSRIVYSNNSMSTESALEVAYNYVYDPTTASGYFFPAILTSEGTNTLLEIGKVANYSSPWYFMWKHNGTSWTKQSWSATPYAQINPKKLLHGEADDYPKETTVSGLYKFDQLPINMSNPAYLINEGQRDQQSSYFSIAAHSLTDTTQFYIDLEPQVLDSIVVDSLGKWSVVLTDESKLAELNSDLNNWGLATINSENLTINFIPDTDRFYFYTIDPSSNVARSSAVVSSGSNGEMEARESRAQPNKVTVSPNPFNPQTQIQVQVREQSTVKLEIYNIAGQLIFTDRKENVTSQTSFNFNAQNLSSGTYLYRVYIGNELFNGRLQLVK